MPETLEFLNDYRTRMDVACEELAATLDDLGIKKPMDDHELVEFASRKLKMLHDIAATVLTPGILAATMKG
jgi:hypothetical protein